MTAGMTQMAQRSGVNSADRAITHHDVKHPQYRLGFANKQVVVAQINQRAAQLKVVINRTWFFIGGQGEDRLVEQLQQHVVQFADPSCDAEIVFHHPLDRLVAFTAVVQALRHAELTIKQQTVVVTTNDQMQGKANAPQDMQTFIQLGTFCLRQKAETDHFIQ